MRSLKGLTIIMFGASGGMGSATAKRIANSGANLAICAIDQEGISKLENDLKEKGASVLSRVVDVREEKQVKQFITDVYNNYGRVDILINFTGILVSGKLQEVPTDRFDMLVDVNFRSVFLTTKYFMDYVDEKEGALIINFGSMGAKRESGGNPQYCATKAAINHFSKCLAHQVTEKNIRITMMNPGPTDTIFYEGSTVTPEMRAPYLKADDIAEMVEYIMTRDKEVIIHDVTMDSMNYFRNQIFKAGAPKATSK